METPLVSVIVPCYNVEAYLPKCIDSILSQTYSNLEIILVDDGSPDRCGEICDEYAKRDSRIRVIHKKNGGLSDARNVAIDIAKGEYITFVDSDDWVHFCYVEILYRNLKQANADISACSFIRTSGNVNENAVTGNGKCSIYNTEEALVNTLYQNRLDNSAWGKLYKSSLFDGVRFTVGRLYEDLDCFYKIYERATILVHTRDVLYYYYYRADSILGVFNKKRIDVLDITDEIVEYMTVRHPSVVKAAKDRKLSANFNILMLLSTTNGGYDDVIARCWKNICELRWGRLFDPKVRLKNKLGIILSFAGLKILMYLFRIYK